MMRWNGWGHPQIELPLTPAAVTFLARVLGPGQPPRDATLADVVARVPASRLPAHPLVTTDAAERVRHASGQSLPDWVAKRGGAFPAFPDGIAFPQSGAEVRALLDYAREAGVRLIPFGGGTSVVGHVTPRPGAAPLLTVNMGRMSRLLQLDETSQLATFGAGVTGADLEATLRARGYLLGHFPQSFEFSTLGGWVVTRSSGQQSLRYGRIEQLFAGGRVETPLGTLDLPTFPASAAGPDLRQIVLGSEGRLGIVTEATVRLAPLPAVEQFRAIAFPDFAAGMAAAREMAQARLPLSMLRLSNAVETETTLLMAGHQRAVSLLDHYLRWRGAGAERCLLLLGATGSRPLVAAATRAALAIARAHGGIHLSTPLGRQWQKQRFRNPYLRNTLWAHGYAVDTVETATPWHNVAPLMTAVEGALREALAAEGERVHPFSHLSHLYPDGSSIYTTFLFRLGATPEATLHRWQRLKGAVSAATVAGGGTISHQHGVGTDHAPYLPAEKGEIGMATLRALVCQFDPTGMMNPGTLLADAQPEVAGGLP